MPTFNARKQDGPETYEALTAILGGQLAVPQTGATTDPTLQGIQPAGDAAVNCLGVAAQDAIPQASQAGLFGTNASYDASYPYFDASVPGITTAVYNDVVGYVTYASAVAYGAKLACAANGAVRAWVAGDGAAAIVGSCKQPGGVSAAGTGLAHIRVPT